MRITSEQLRRIVKEEVRRLREGEVSPDWEELVSACAGAAGEAFKDANATPADGDGMGEERGGQAAWDQQVEDAGQALSDELYELIAPVVQSVQTRLDEGEFWKG